MVFYALAETSQQFWLVERKSGLIPSHTVLLEVIFIAMLADTLE